MMNQLTQFTISMTRSGSCCCLSPRRQTHHVVEKIMQPQRPKSKSTPRVPSGGRVVRGPTSAAATTGTGTGSRSVLVSSSVADATLDVKCSYAAHQLLHEFSVSDGGKPQRTPDNEDSIAFEVIRRNDAAAQASRNCTAMLLRDGNPISSALELPMPPVVLASLSIVVSLRRPSISFGTVIENTQSLDNVIGACALLCEALHASAGTLAPIVLHGRPSMTTITSCRQLDTIMQLFDRFKQLHVSAYEVALRSVLLWCVLEAHRNINQCDVCADRLGSCENAQAAAEALRDLQHDEWCSTTKWCIADRLGFAVAKVWNVFDRANDVSDAATLAREFAEAVFRNEKRAMWIHTDRLAGVLLPMSRNHHVMKSVTIQ